jgi:xylulokinase
MAVALGIDLGTSAVKCVLNRQGSTIGSGSAGLTISSPLPGWAEQDPSDWITATENALLEAISNAGISGRHISGISLSGQMHGAVLLDSNDTVLRPAILWNDSRSTIETGSLSNHLPDIGMIAGVPPQPGFTAPKLMWLKAHEPLVFAKINKILLPKDFVTFWLTGRHVTDTSDAAGTLWLDQRKRNWSSTLCDASDVDMDWLPPLLNGFDTAGEVTSHASAALGIPKGIPVFAGGGDAAVGTISIGATTPGQSFISLGTSGQLMVVDDTYQPNPDQFVHAFCHTLPERWYRMAAMLNGARPLSWFASILNCSVPQMLEDASNANLSRIPLFLPYLTGERSPHGDPHIRASFYGIEDSTGRAEMARAVVEAIAFMMCDAKDSFGANVHMTGIIPVIGGGSRSPLILQTLATTLDQTVGRIQLGDQGAAYGAALLAEVGLHQRSQADLKDEPAFSDVYYPEKQPELFMRLEQYRALYRALKDFGKS